MTKYIIDVPDDTTCINALKYEDSKCVAARSYIIPDLTPYTEPDLSPLVDEAVETVENEVWEFASMLMNMHPDVAEDIYWSMNGGKGIGVAAEMTYQDAKAKYEAWKRQKDEIRVGDELKDDGNIRAVVLDILDEDYVSYEVFTENGVTDEWQKGIVVKTGRHFNEVEELMKKMRDAE